MEHTINPNIIDGKSIAQKVTKELAHRINQKNIQLKMVVMLVWDCHASKIYIKHKKKKSTSLNIQCDVIELPAHIKQDFLLKQIEKFNQDKSVNGIIVQLPLPNHIDKTMVIKAIDPIKDIDGFHPINQKKLKHGDISWLIPATPLGIIRIFQEEGIELQGKKITIIWRSPIVWEPLFHLLKRYHSEVRSCNTKTKKNDMNSWIQTSDIVISAAGCPKLLTVDMLKPGAIVIDVWMNRDENGKLCWDADFYHIVRQGHKITPVPWWVWPMTVTMLMSNLYQAYTLQHDASLKANLGQEK